MSDLELALDSVKQGREEGIPATFVGGLPYRAREDSTNTFEDLLYYLGKPEEWLVRGIGSLATDDPKYDVPSTNLYDQTSFFDISQELTGLRSGAGNFLVNMPLGLAAAVLNPLDPLNVASFAKSTKLGVMADLATRAADPRAGMKMFTRHIKRLKDVDAGIDAMKTTSNATRQIDTAAELGTLRKRLEQATLRKNRNVILGRINKAKASGRHEEAAKLQKKFDEAFKSEEASLLQNQLKSATADRRRRKLKTKSQEELNLSGRLAEAQKKERAFVPNEIDDIKKNIERYKRQMPQLQKVNAWLKQMQEVEGIPYADLVKKKTFFERVRAGQQVTIGASLYDNPIIRKMGGIGRRDMIARGAAKVGIIDKALVGTEKFPGALYPVVRAGEAARDLGAKALNKIFALKGTNAAIPIEQTSKFIASVYHKLKKATASGEEFDVQTALREYNFLGKGVTPEDLQQIFRTLEDSFAGVELRTIQDMIDSDETIFANIRSVSGKERDLGFPGSARSEFDQERLRIEQEESGSYKSRNLLVELPIDDYLRLAEDVGEPVADKLKGINDALDSGEKLSDIPYLQINKEGSVTAHEGRHRAIALRKRGFKTIPVVLRSENVRWSEQLAAEIGGRKVFDFVENLPATLRQQGGGPGRVAAPFHVSGPKRGAPIVKPVERQKHLGVRGVDLSRQQKELIAEEGTRRGVKDSEDLAIAVGNAERAMESGSTFPAKVVSDADNLHIDANHIVVRLPDTKTATKLGVRNKISQLMHGIEERDIKGIGDVPGVVPFSTHTKDGQFYLVAPNSGVGPNVEWTSLHVQNLERTTAMLAQRGWMIQDLSPSKVLAGPNGEIQIIDPTVFRPMRKNVKNRIEEAAARSEGVIRSKLFPGIGVPEDYDFTILRSGENQIKAVKNTDFEFADLTPNAQKLTSDGSVKFFNVEDLLTSHNAGWAKILDEETINRFGIDLLAQEIDKAGVMLPVRIRVDDTGQVYVTEGLERLAAAKGLGLEAVPVIREDFVGEVSSELAGQGAKGLESPVLGPSRSAQEVMAGRGAAYDAFDEALQAELPPNLHILNDKNREQMLSEKVAFRPVDEAEIHNKLARWFSRREATDEATKRLGPRYYDSAEGALLDLMGITGASPTEGRLAFIKLSRALEGARDPHDALSRLAREFGLERRGGNLQLPHGGARSARNGPLASDYADMTQELAMLKTELRDLTDKMNSRGVFTDMSPNAAIGDFTTKGRTVIQVGDDALEFTNRSKTVDGMHDLAQNYISQNASDISRHTRVDLFGETPLATRADDLLGPKPQLEPVLPGQKSFFVSDETRKALREKDIFINPTRADLERFGLQTAAGRVTERPKGVFGVSLSGSLIFAPNHSSIETLLDDVFGKQGPRFLQEFGTFSADGIMISNALGLKGMGRLTADELKPVARRMKEIAKRLQKAGFDKEMTLGFTTPFGDLWDKLYKKNTSLGDVAAKEFRLKPPKELDGLSLKLYDERAAVGVFEKYKDLPDGPIRSLYRWAEETLDDIAVKELNEALPLNVRAGYFPRFLSPELLKKLDDLGVKMFKNEQRNHDYLNYWIKNFHERSLSDLTMDEVQKLFKDLQIGGNDLMAADKELGTGFMKSLAQADPEAALFFIEDPILAVTMRKNLSNQAIENKRAFEALVDPENNLVAWTGDINDFFAQNQLNGSVLELTRAQNAKNVEVMELRKVLGDAKAEAEDIAIIEDLQKQVDEAQTELDAMSQKLIDAAQAQKKAGNFPLTGNIDPMTRQVGIDTGEARRLISEGVLDEQDFAGANWSAPYVVTQVQSMTRADALGNVKMHVFHEEVIPVLDQYFGLATNKGGVWDNFIEKVFDPLNRLFKETTLFLFPAVVPYTTRNFFSNALLGWLGGVDMDSYADSLSILNKISKYNRGGVAIGEMESVLKETRMMNAAGQESSLYDMWGAFVNSGGLSGGLHINEFGVSNQVLKESMQRGFTPATDLVSGTMHLGNKLLEGGRNFSSLLENHFRFGAFIDTWKKGGSFEDAALNVKKIFYNYSELNMFERKVMKRIIPFYSWMRFNTPRMLETMATRPIVHYRLQKAVNDIERGAGGPASEEELPSWLSDRWSITVGRDNGKLIIMGADYLLPMGDVRRLLQSPLQFAVDGVTPFMKYPIEQVMNRSLFSNKLADLFSGGGRPLERVPGEPARSGTLREAGFTKRATFTGPMGLGNLLFNESLVQNVRAVKWILDWVDWSWGQTNIREEVPTWNARIMDAMFARAYTIDPDRYHSIMKLEADKWIRRFKWGYKDAVRRGDRFLMDFYLKRMTDAATRK